MTNAIERNDTVYAAVVCRTGSGCCAGIDGVDHCPCAFFRGTGEKDDKVLLTVLRVFDDRIFTSLDAVIRHAA